MKLLTQVYIVAILSKVTLCLTILFLSDHSDISKGAYNFITLFGSVVFIVALGIEIYKKNYVIGLFALAGLIVFQPLRPIFKGKIYDNDVFVNTELLGVSFLVLLVWIIYDIVMLIITIRNNYAK